ncbi:MAG: response regulator [Burkholderiales bacterium]|nr:response regulator [Burkholderiales bacterium]
MGIRVYLAAMAAAVLIPLVALSGFGLDRLLKAEQAAAIRGVLEMARAVSLAADQELVSAEAALRVLATSAYLKAEDIASFHDQAMAARTTEAGWIVLYDEAGRQVTDTRYPFGAMPATATPAPAWPQAPAYGRALISDLHRSTDTKRFIVTIAVPVTVAGRPHSIVQAFEASYFERVFAERKVPGNWTVGIFDRDHTTITRSTRAADFVGEPGSADLRHAATNAAEGSLRDRSREGADVYAVFTRSPRSGWLVAIGVPVEGLDAYAERAVALAALATLAIIALAASIVLLLGRRLSRSIASIAAATAALGRGEALPPYAASVRELDQVRVALDNTHAALERETDLRARAEAERLQLFESEQAARQAAEQQNRAKDEFLAMLGHELRNPLSAISGAVALMKSASAQEEHRLHARDVITRQTQHLSRVVDDLLDLSRVMTGKVVLEFAPIDLAEVAAHCLDSMRAAGRVGAHQVRFTAEPVWVNADATRLEQIIVNLLSNALKYTPQDGRVEMHVEAQAEAALLRVLDSGLGIPKHLLPHVFDIFVQGEQSLDRAKGGLGIGLALVQRLVQLHGGSVTAESPGDARGSIFTVRLPRVAIPARNSDAIPRADAHGRKLRVLVVDDHEDSRTMLRLLLEQTGHEAIEAVDGIDGVQLALSRRPDAAIIDIGLPGINGYEVARRLRALPTAANTGLIALTGYGQDEDRYRALEAGFDLHLVKPVGADRLVQALLEVTRTRSVAPRNEAANKT